MDWIAASYLTYLAVTVPLTIWVASTLSSNGRVFLEDVFTENAALADAINKLLVVGFYLLNVGFVLLYLRTGGLVSDLSEPDGGGQREGRRRDGRARPHPLHQRLRLQRDPPSGPDGELPHPPLPPQQFLNPAQPAYPR